MSNRLGGKQGTAYLGTNANQPPNWTFSDRDPNQYDTQNVSLGDLWLNQDNETVWVLVSLAGNMSSKGSIAVWSKIEASIGILNALTGNTGGAVSPDGSSNINIIGDGTTITIAGNPGTHTLTASVIGGGSGASSFPTDSGTAAPVAGVLHIIAGTPLLTCGSSVSFSGVSNIIELNVSDLNNNTIIGNSAGSAVLTGTRNIGLGFQAANLYTGTESNNIIIGSHGVAADNHTIRLGINGSSIGQQNKCFIAGIDGVNVGSTANVVTEVGNQLGTAVITGGSGITVTSSANTITISGSGTIIYTYTNVSSSPYVVLTTDYYISVNSSGGAITVQLPNAATVGKTFIIKDRTGSAATNNITITTVGGAVNIDGATTFVMNSAYQSISVLGNGTTYEIY
jgi:hypothetical protein